MRWIIFSRMKIGKGKIKDGDKKTQEVE